MANSPDTSWVYRIACTNCTRECPFIGSKWASSGNVGPFCDECWALLQPNEALRKVAQQPFTQSDPGLVTRLREMAASLSKEAGHVDVEWGFDFIEDGPQAGDGYRGWAKTVSDAADAIDTALQQLQEAETYKKYLADPLHVLKIVQAERDTALREREALEQKVRDMRLANKAVDDADGPRAYQLALVALGLGARQFLRAPSPTSEDPS